MALLNVQAISKAGLASISGALAAADAAGDSVKSANGLVLIVENTDTSAHTVTVARPFATTRANNLGELAVTDITLTVPASGMGAVTIPSGFDANGDFSWTYDAVTGVNVGVFSLNP